MNVDIEPKVVHADLDSLHEGYSAPDAIPMFRDRVVLIPCTETAAARSNFFYLLQQPNVIVTSCNNKATVYRQPGYCFVVLDRIYIKLLLFVIYFFVSFFLSLDEGVFVDLIYTDFFIRLI
ncbi:unnamed protein product [Rotaria sp. Silwood2]|nr:unnamed protein product [Rotaria sp. Silwood2]CAF4725791.1 unnamed protein product [Rotaria sp. Silwood2]